MTQTQKNPEPKPEKKLSVHERLVVIQRELKAPKNQKNNFGNYNYRSCEDIVEAVKPLLGDCSLTLGDAIVLIGDRYYVKATASLTNGEAILSVDAYAREALDKKGMDDAQITGSASSYARKYALNGLFAIDDTADADTMDNTTQTTKAVAKAVATVATQTPNTSNPGPGRAFTKATTKQLTMLNDLSRTKNITIDIDKAANLSIEGASVIIKKMIEMPGGGEIKL